MGILGLGKEEAGGKGRRKNRDDDSILVVRDLRG